MSWCLIGAVVSHAERACLPRSRSRRRKRKEPDQAIDRSTISVDPERPGHDRIIDPVSTVEDPGTCVRIGLDTRIRLALAGVAFSAERRISTLGIAIMIAVFASAGGYASAQTFVDGFAPAIGVSAALAAIGAVISLAIPGRAGSPASPIQTGESTPLLPVRGAEGGE